MTDLLSREATSHQNEESQEEVEKMDTEDSCTPGVEKMETDKGSEEAMVACSGEDEVEQEEMEEEEKKEKVGVELKSPSLKIYHAIIKTILPSLQNVLTKKVRITCGLSFFFFFFLFFFFFFCCSYIFCC